MALIPMLPEDQVPQQPAIPLVDLKAAHEQVEHEVIQGFGRIFESAAFVGGREVTDFEHEYAAFAGARHCVGVANGTDALELALRAAGVGPGDEVVLPANTYVATAEAVVRSGARPVFVDCDAATGLIDVGAAISAVGPRTKAVVPVHLFGQLAPVEQLRQALNASGTGVRIVEDAAQSQGASRLGHRPGNGGIASTSFYPGKNLGAYGDAGAVLTDDPALEAAVRSMANHGSRRKYEHDVVGFNSRLDALQAVVLRAKLRHLSYWNAARRTAAAVYDHLLADHPWIERPVTLEGNEHVWHLYVVKIGIPNGGGAGGASAVRDAVVAKLHEAGIGVGMHYPTALHRTKAFAHLGYEKGDFPHAEDAADRNLSLPLHPHITEAHQERVVQALLSALG